MIDAFTRINWIAVAIAVMATALLGGVYFGALVRKPYLRVLGRKERQVPGPTPVTTAGPLICGILVVLTSAVLVAALNLATVADAVVFGLVVGVGYLVAMTFQIAINPNFPHPLRYGALNTPYFLATSLVTSLVLVLI